MVNSGVEDAGAGSVLTKTGSEVNIALTLYLMAEADLNQERLKKRIGPIIADEDAYHREWWIVAGAAGPLRDLFQHGCGPAVRASINPTSG